MEARRLHWELCPTPLYSELDREYQQQYSGPYKDCSLWEDEGALIASEKDGVVTGYGRPVMIFGKLREKVLKRHLDAHLPMVFCDYVEGGLSPASRILLKRGYTARPYYTQVIDLTKPPSELHADMRKSYKSLVNHSYGEVWGNKAFMRLRDYHCAMHGHIRSSDTWAIQWRMLDNCALCAADHGAAALVYYNSRHAYYACGASLPDANSHAVMWRLILKCQEMGLETLEMGEQVYRGDSKLVNIAKFKRGFGGQTKVRLLLEKP